MKKIVSILFLLMILCSFRLVSLAEDYDFKSVAENVATKIDVPSNYTEFTSYADIKSDSFNYVLSWSGGDSNDGGVLTVVTDSKFRIISSYQYRYGKYNGNYKLSSVDYNQACVIAKEYIEKTSPEFSEKFLLYKQSNYILTNKGKYNILFYRYENSIPCYDNYAIVCVDAYTKEVTEYQVVFEDYIKISPASSYISKNEALKIFNNEIGIELGYSKSDSGINLIYSTNMYGTKFVSAYSGTIIDTGMAPNNSAYNYCKKLECEESLTPAEGSYSLPGITDNKLRRNPYLHIPSDYDIADVSYYSDSNSDLYAKISYKNYTNVPIDVTINMKNLEIVAFNASRQQTEVSKMLSDKACLKIASGFAFEHIKSIYKVCKSAVVIPSDNVNIFKVKYPQIVNGIPYYDKGIIIEIDRANGYVISLSASKEKEMDFPLSIPDISYEQAYGILINQVGFELQYVPVMTADGKELRIVYSFSPIVPLYVNAQIGMLCTKNGEVYSVENTKTYSDIENNASKMQIETLLLAGIMNIPGESFEPDTKITAKEFSTIMLKVFGETFEFNNEDEFITHEQAVEALINILGYGDIAYINDTYRTDFIDSAAIEQNLVGCAAIAKGLGIIKGNAFLPKRLVTRAYCAELIYNTITDQIQNEGDDLNEN